MVPRLSGGCISIDLAFSHYSKRLKKKRLFISLTISEVPWVNDNAISREKPQSHHLTKALLEELRLFSQQ